MKTYQILIDGTPYDPTNFGQVSIAIENYRENGAYAYRRKLSDNLTFQKAAYNYILQQINISQCTEIEIEIQERCTAGAGWETILNGIFTRQACVVDYDRCSIEAEIKTVDEYSCLVENGDRKINIFTVSDLDVPREDFPYSNLYNIEALVVPNVGPDCTDDLPEWGLPYNSVPFVGSSGEDYCLWLRQIAVVPCIAGAPNPPPPAASDWFLLQDACNPDGTGWAKYWRRIDPLELTIVFTTYACTPAPCTPLSCGSNCIDAGVFATPIGEERVCICADPDAILPNGRALVGSLDYILSEICDPPLTISSELLTNDINPVTGLADNPMQFLYLFAKSDIVNSDASNVATRMELSIFDALGTYRSY